MELAKVFLGLLLLLGGGWFLEEGLAAGETAELGRGLRSVGEARGAAGGGGPAPVLQAVAGGFRPLGPATARLAGSRIALGARRGPDGSRASGLWGKRGTAHFDTDWILKQLSGVLAQQ